MHIESRVILTRSLALAFALPLLAAGSVKANPQGGEVVAGSASITSPNATTLQVDQMSDRAVINWNSFNVDPGETTRFVVPNSESWTLNRVIGSQNPSRIYGSVVSNGNLVIVNPDGIHFGAGSSVDVNRLIATTADTTNDDFMSGRFRFGTPGDPSASIVNEGVISAADYGLAALVAPSVRNSGIITARLGSVGLTSGNSFTIDPYGDGLIKLAIGEEVASEVYDVATGETVSDLVTNEGLLSADGGTVAMTAAVAREAVNSVVNNTGIVEARSVGMQNGMIVLGGSTAATKPPEAPTQVVQVSGTLDASGSHELYPLGEPVGGGRIEITGEVIASTDASITASGSHGGGTVLIGGDYLGGNVDAQDALALGVSLEDREIDRASLVVLSETASIEADAVQTGDGGKIIVWSDDTTVTSAAISARGGAEAGDGGFIETSGKNYLSVLVAADASATNGEAGTWLMDPVNIAVVNGVDRFTTVLPNQVVGEIPIQGGVAQIIADVFVPVDQYTLTPDGSGGFTRTNIHSDTSFIDAATIEAALNSGTGVLITNVNSIGDDAGTISIEADINKVAGAAASLGFNAADDIVISPNVDITSSSGELLLSFASAEGQIRGSNIGVLDTNGGLLLLVAKEGASISATDIVSEAGKPSAIQIDVQNYDNSAGSIDLSIAGSRIIGFTFDPTTVSFGQNAIDLSGNSRLIQVAMDQDVVLADGAIRDTSQSQIQLIFVDPASTVTAAQPGNDIPEIESNGLVRVASSAGVGGQLNVLPVVEVPVTMSPTQQCEGLTCVQVMPVVVVPPMPPAPTDELGQTESEPDLALTSTERNYPLADDIRFVSEDDIRKQGRKLLERLFEQANKDYRFWELIEIVNDIWNLGVTFDSPYHMAQFNQEIFEFRGRSLTGSDLNYYYIGLFFSAYGWPEATMKPVIYAWKQSQYGVDPTDDALWAAQQGFRDGVTYQYTELQ